MPGLLALTHRELLRFVRQPSRIVAALGTPLLLWLFLGSGFAGTFSSAQGPGGGAGAGSAAYAQHLFPGMAGLTIVFTSIFAAISLIDDRNEGFLQGVLVSPLPRWGLVGSKVLGGCIVATAQAAVLLPAALVVGLRPGIAGFVLSTLAIASMSLIVNGLSLALAWRINSVPGFHGVMNLILMPMWLLSGSFFPIDGAAPWLRAVMLINPLTWPNEAMRSSLTGSQSHPAAWPLTLLFAAASMLMALVMIGRASRTAG